MAPDPGANILALKAAIAAALQASSLPDQFQALVLRRIQTSPEPVETALLLLTEFQDRANVTDAEFITASELAARIRALQRQSR